MTPEWVFVRSRAGFGNWKPQGGSPNTDEDYIITEAGTWVPAIDWTWLAEFRKVCPCKPGSGSMQMFSLLRPDVDQLRTKPQRDPKYHKSPNFGLSSVED